MKVPWNKATKKNIYKKIYEIKDGKQRKRKGSQIIKAKKKYRH